MGTDLAPDATRLTKRFTAAVAWAADLHADQARKGKPGVPYISHPLGVAALVLADGGSEDEAIAGLLHDVMEDCDVPLSDIWWQFGDVVSRIVDSATDTLPGSDERGAADWAERKRRYLSHLEDVDTPTLRVSAADKLYNARDLVADLRAEGSKTMERFNANADDVLWYYSSLAELFDRRMPGVLANELAITVDLLSAELH